MSIIQLDLATVLAFLSIIGSLIAIISFASQRKKAAMEEGKRAETAEQLRRDLDRAHEKIRVLETNTQKADVMLAEIRTDVKHIMESLREIRERMEAAK